jgi:hypothetical protein
MQFWGEGTGKHSAFSLEKNLGQIHYIYQDSFYNSVKLAGTLLDKKTYC